MAEATTTSQDDVRKNYGWQQVPLSHKKLLQGQETTTKPMRIEDVHEPQSDIASLVRDYAKQHLPRQTYNHSMRVYYFGYAIIKQHFPAFEPMLETFFFAALLHDIGTTPENLKSTMMSFEFYGAYLALDLILNRLSGPKEQAESVAETIIRHQDLGETGTTTACTAVIQLATVFDNVGMHPQLVDKETIQRVVAAFPREGWSECFASTIRKEVDRKPWAHTTAIDKFAEKVEGNQLMAPYEK